LRDKLQMGPTALAAQLLVAVGLMGLLVCGTPTHSSTDERTFLALINAARVGNTQQPPPFHYVSPN
jgi:hypothetical protein